MKLIKPKYCYVKLIKYNDNLISEMNMTPVTQKRNTIEINIIKFSFYSNSINTQLLHNM